MGRHRRPIRPWKLPEGAPVPQGQAAAVETALDHALVRGLGAVPVLLPLAEQPGLREIVNRRCYPRATSPRTWMWAA